MSRKSLLTFNDQLKLKQVYLASGSVGEDRGFFSRLFPIGGTFRAGRTLHNSTIQNRSAVTFYSFRERKFLS